MCILTQEQKTDIDERQSNESECSERTRGLQRCSSEERKQGNRKEKQNKTKKAESRKEVEMVPAEGPHSDEILSIQNRRQRALIIEVVTHVSLCVPADYGYKGSAWSLSILETADFPTPAPKLETLCLQMELSSIQRTTVSVQHFLLLCKVQINCSSLISIGISAFLVRSEAQSPWKKILLFLPVFRILTSFFRKIQFNSTNILKDFQSDAKRKER